MRERYKSLSREIIVPFELDMELKDVVFTIPQRGDKKKLLELSILNVKQYKADRLKQTEKLNPGTAHCASLERNPRGIASRPAAYAHRMF